MKKISRIFWIFAGLLSHLMCANVAYNYSEMWWGVRYAAYSAPVWTAFLVVIPYSIGILVCITLALFFKKKAERE